MDVSTATFDLPPNLAPFSAPLRIFRDSYDSETRLVVGGFVFSRSCPNASTSKGFAEPKAQPEAEPRMLLLHRASSDAYGDLWDFPGGSCEESDASLLDAVKREVWEETGLRVTDDMEYVGMHTWEHDRKKGDCKWAKFSFTVKVAETTSQIESPGIGTLPDIKLAETEHQAFMWATEENIKDSLVEKNDALKFIATEEIQIAAEAFKRFKSSIGHPMRHS